MTDREQESLIRTSNERANFKSWCREIAPAIYESTREAMWQAWKARSRCPVETSAVLENERMESSNEQVQTADIEACRAWLVQSRTSVFGSHQIIAMLDELLKCRHAVETSAPLPFAQRYRPITNGAAFMGMVAVGRPNAWGGQQCDYVQAADYDRLVALIRPSAVKATASPNDALRWICPTCRTVNAIEAAHCEIRTCNTPRPNAVNGTPQPLIDWKASYEEALRQRDALTADAERYRFLRNHTWVEAYWIDGAGGVDTKARVTGCVDHLDQAVDMERIKERPDAAKATMCPPHRYNAFGWCDDCSHVRVPEPVGSPENGTQQP